MTLPPVRVLVADDDRSMREVLAEIFNADAGFDLVAAAADANAAVELARAARPDVALLDVKMPGGGRRAAEGIRAASPQTRVVALSVYSDHPTIIEMFRAGAVGYLVKGSATAGEIAETVRSAAAGEVSLPRDVAGHVIDELSAQLKRGQRAEEEWQRAAGRVRRVLTLRRLTLAFQPIFELPSGTVAGVEALARFPQVPPRGPDVWFAEAHMVGLGTELERLAVEIAVGELDRLADDEYLSVNLSPDGAMADSVHEVLLAADPARTVVEITEHAKIADYEYFNQRLEPLRAAGVRVAIDDAGAGFASLRHILQVAPDVIKLDISLTRNIHADRSRRALARALTSFAIETGAVVVAEGIEDADELAALRMLGVTYGQGYLLGRPSVPGGCAGSVSPGSNFRNTTDPVDGAADCRRTV